jgi:hypothetical protein
MSLNWLERRKMTPIGTLNTGWGVCGFTSTLYSLYELNPGMRRLLINRSRIGGTVLAEIKTYLMMLQAENSHLLQSIQEFTQTFDLPGWTINNYIEEINKASSLDQKAILASKEYGIAMPPEAVVDYVRRVWGLHAERWKWSGDPGADGIIGVSNQMKTMSMYNGLCHWMYRSNRKIYSWGKVFNSVRAAGENVCANYQVEHFILISRPK